MIRMSWSGPATAAPPSAACRSGSARGTGRKPHRATSAAGPGETSTSRSTRSGCSRGEQGADQAAHRVAVQREGAPSPGGRPPRARARAWPSHGQRRARGGRGVPEPGEVEGDDRDRSGAAPRSTSTQLDADPPRPCTSSCGGRRLRRAPVGPQHPDRSATEVDHLLDDAVPGRIELSPVSGPHGATVPAASAGVVTREAPLGPISGPVGWFSLVNRDQMGPIRARPADGGPSVPPVPRPPPGDSPMFDTAPEATARRTCPTTCRARSAATPCTPTWRARTPAPASPSALRAAA